MINYGFQKYPAPHNFPGCTRRDFIVYEQLARALVSPSEWALGDLDERFDRISALSVSRGLHVLRYVTFDGVGAPAIARFLPADKGMSLVDMPGREDGRLLAPGDCLVIRADRGGEAQVALKRGSVDGALEATFRLDVLVRCEEIAELAAAPPPPAVSFLAHIALVGDTKFDQSAWAAGPESPGIIEGLQIVSDVESPLEMQVLLGGRPARWSDWVGAGVYAGTRGYGLPLLGVRLRLNPNAVGMEISAEALFLGALVASQRGRALEFVSGSGVDPLVGVKIALEKTLARTPGVIGGSEPASPAREPRVRVFRASAAR